MKVWFFQKNINSVWRSGHGVRVLKVMVCPVLAVFDQSHSGNIHPPLFSFSPPPLRIVFSPNHQTKWEVLLGLCSIERSVGSERDRDRQLRRNKNKNETNAKTKRLLVYCGDHWPMENQFSSDRFQYSTLKRFYYKRSYFFLFQFSGLGPPLSKKYKMSVSFEYCQREFKVTLDWFRTECQYFSVLSLDDFIKYSWAT